MDEIKELNSVAKTDKFDKNEQFKKQKYAKKEEKKTDLVLNNDEEVKDEAKPIEELNVEKVAKEVKQEVKKEIPSQKKRGEVVLKGIATISVRIENGTLLTLMGYHDAQIGDIVEY